MTAVVFVLVLVMGNKDSKPTDVFYTVNISHLKVSREKVIKRLEEKLKNENFTLRPLSPQSSQPAGPTLVVRDSATESQLKQLLLESQSLRVDHLMVVLTRQVYPGYQAGTLVQLEWPNKSDAQSQKSFTMIMDFLKEGGRRGSSSPVDPEQHGKGATAAHAEEVPSSSVSPITVNMAFGDRADSLMRDAVSFVEDECGIKLVECANVYTCSPLLVFCKNDTKLQEDIRHATENTRAGADVMILIITDRLDLILQDTEATKKLGAKGCLFFDHARHKFGYTSNKKTLSWIRIFLKKYQIHISLKINRFKTIRRSLNLWQKSPQIGSYHVLGDLPEEQLKNVIVYFDKQNVGFNEAKDIHNTHPLILFCAASQQPEHQVATFMSTRKDALGVLVVIIHRAFDDPDLRRIARYHKLAIHDISPDVVDNAQNARTATAVRKFIKAQTPPSARPDGDEQSPRTGDVSPRGDGQQGERHASLGAKRSQGVGSEDTDEQTMEVDVNDSLESPVDLPSTYFPQPEQTILDYNNDYDIRSSSTYSNIHGPNVPHNARSVSQESSEYNTLQSFLSSLPQHRPLPHSPHYHYASTNLSSTSVVSGVSTRVHSGQGPESGVELPIPPPNSEQGLLPGYVSLRPVSSAANHYTGTRSSQHHNAFSSVHTWSASHTVPSQTADYVSDTSQSVHMMNDASSDVSSRPIKTVNSLQRRRKHRPALPVFQQVEMMSPYRDCVRVRGAKRSVSDRYEVGVRVDEGHLVDVFGGLTIGGKKRKVCFSPEETETPTT